MDQRDAELLDRWLVPRFRRDATTGLSDFNDSQRRNDDGGSYRKIPDGLSNNSAPASETLSPLRRAAPRRLLAS